MTRAAVYARAGRDDSGDAISRQITECEAFAARQGWPVLERFADVGPGTGRQATLPGRRALLEAVDRGDVDAVVVLTSDRLGRSPKDVLAVIETADRHNVTVRTVDGSDLMTATHRLLLLTMNAVEEREHERRSERAKAAARTRKANRAQS